MSDRLLNTKDVAAKLRSTEKSVRSARARGLIPPGVKLPGIGLRFREAEIDAWIAAQAKKGSAA